MWLDVLVARFYDPGLLTRADVRMDCKGEGGLGVSELGLRQMGCSCFLY